MSEVDIETTLRMLAAGELSVEDALLRFKRQPFEDLGFAKLDHHRAIRQGAAEVVYGEGKTTEQLHAICSALAKAQDCVLITRLSADAAADLQGVFNLDYHKESRVGVIGALPEPSGNGSIVVAAAGTSDLPVAEEAALTAEALGNKVVRLYDVGVAGLHRLLSQMDVLANAQAIVAVAGMEGALPSVVSGLVSCPVIAVPTSVGYGASFGGLAALLSMLNSCASGVSVVNIDNGFGAGFQAHQINHLRIPDSAEAAAGASASAGDKNAAGETLQRSHGAARTYSVDNCRAAGFDDGASAHDGFLSALGSILRPVVGHANTHAGEGGNLEIGSGLKTEARADADTAEIPVPGLQHTAPLPFLQKTVAFSAEEVSAALAAQREEEDRAAQAAPAQGKPDKEEGAVESEPTQGEASLERGARDQVRATAPADKSESQDAAEAQAAEAAEGQKSTAEEQGSAAEPREIMLDLSQTATRKSILDQLESLLDADQRKRRALILREARVPAKQHHDIAEVNESIDGLNAPDELKGHLRAVYDILAHAEAKAHDVPVEETHFHEVGKGLSILNALTIAATFYVLEPSFVRATAVQTGQGTVECAHGTMDIPAPATAAIIDEGLPVVSKDELLEGELCTPTSAAIIKHFVQEFVTEG